MSAQSAMATIKNEVWLVSYLPDVAAALSGATLRQLSYWRSAGTPEPLLSPEFHKPRSRVSYSFQDVVALRTFVYLRASDVPLQRNRKAIKSLREMGEVEHLASYKLVADGRDVVWLSDDVAVDLTRSPGQQVIAKMVKIVSLFRTAQGGTVVHLLEPKPGITVDPDVRSGYPVIHGTRVPYDVVAGLLEDGLSIDDVRAFYPSVDAAAVQGAVEFAQHVSRHAKAA